MDVAPPPCATCGWHGVRTGPFCPSCGAQLPPVGTVLAPAPAPAADTSRVGGRIALLALAGALLIIFLTLFVVGIALGDRGAGDNAAPTLAPEFASATALLTVAPQTPAPDPTRTPRETPGGGGGSGGGKPTITPSPSPTVCLSCG